MAPESAPEVTKLSPRVSKMEAPSPPNANPEEPKGADGRGRSSYENRNVTAFGRTTQINSRKINFGEIQFLEIKDLKYLKFPKYACRTGSRSV